MLKPFEACYSAYQYKLGRIYTVFGFLFAFCPFLLLLKMYAIFRPILTLFYTEYLTNGFYTGRRGKNAPYLTSKPNTKCEGNTKFGMRVSFQNFKKKWF